MGCAHREYEVCNICNEKENAQKIDNVSALQNLEKQNRILQKRLREYAKQNLYYIKSLRNAEERNYRQRQDLRKLKEAYVTQIGLVPYYSSVIVNSIESVLKYCKIRIKRLLARVSSH